MPQLKLQSRVAQFDLLSGKEFVLELAGHSCPLRCGRTGMSNLRFHDYFGASSDGASAAGASDAGVSAAGISDGATDGSIVSK